MQMFWKQKLLQLVDIPLDQSTMKDQLDGSRKGVHFQKSRERNFRALFSLHKPLKTFEELAHQPCC